MSCIAVNCNTQKGEKIFKSHMHHNPKTADICWIIFFFTLSLETCHIAIKKPKWETERLFTCLTFQPRSISENSVEWSTNKGGKCKLQLSQQPSLTITNITSLFSIFTLMYTKYTQKGDFFFSSLLNASKSSCTFRAIRIKEYLYINN